jgi:ParB family transcriptional regulator, chromosome partitioning protein
MMADNENSTDVSATAPVRARRPAGLGRGLSALLGEAPGGPISTQATAGARTGLMLLPLGEVRPHPGQPRRHFNEDALAELADSIAAKGVVQPILVRPSPEGGGWQIVAGERRWRASQRAGLHQIPAVVRDLDDNDCFTIALVENIQRQDLTAIEEAEAFARLRDQLGHTTDAIATMTGKSRSHIANILRLLDLPESVRALVASGALGMGHARALIGHADAEALARTIVAKGLSVRKVEALVRKARGGNEGERVPTAPRAPGQTMPDADIAALEAHLADLLGVRVRIGHSQDMTGTLSLDYSNLEQLDMLCQRLSGERI